MHSDEVNEVWFRVPGYEGLYDVSNLGRVRSHPHKRRILARDGKTWGLAQWPGRILSPVRRRSGHM